MIVERLNRAEADPFDFDTLCTHACIDQTDEGDFDLEIVNLARAAVCEAEEHGPLAVLFQTIRLSK